VHTPRVDMRVRVCGDITSVCVHTVCVYVCSIVYWYVCAVCMRARARGCVSVRDKKRN